MDLIKIKLLKESSRLKNNCYEKNLPHVYTEKTVLSNQQKYFVSIELTKFFCCANKTFCYINQILLLKQNVLL